MTVVVVHNRADRQGAAADPFLHLDPCSSIEYPLLQSPWSRETERAIQNIFTCNITTYVVIHYIML